MRLSSASSASQTAESANRPPTQRAPRLDKPGWTAICAHSPLGSLPALAQRRSARMVEGATSASQATPSSSLFGQREGDKPPSTLRIVARIDRELTAKCWVGFIDWLDAFSALSSIDRIMRPNPTISIESQYERSLLP